MSNNDTWQEPTKEPNLFEKILILLMIIISELFFQRGKHG